MKEVTREPREEQEKSDEEETLIESKRELVTNGREMAGEKHNGREQKN